MRRLAAALIVAAAPAAAADGFAVKDLRAVVDAVDASAFTGGTFVAAADDPARLTIFCGDCETITVVDIQIDLATDGTEGRLRSGETTYDLLQTNCEAREPSCRLVPAQLGAAVGWATSYKIEDHMGSTLVLLKDGERLIARSIGPNAETAVANAVTARLGVIRAIVIGEDIKLDEGKIGQ